MRFNITARLNNIKKLKLFVEQKNTSELILRQRCSYGS